MARTKGSKNKATLVREMRESGCSDPSLDGLDYKTVAQYHTLVMAGQPLPNTTPEVKPQPPVAVEKTRVAAEVAKPIYEDCEHKLRSMADWYGYEDELPERVTSMLVSIYYAETVDEARQRARKALDRMHTTLLSMWGKKRIFGPPTADNIEARIAKAERLCDMLAKKGDHNGYDSQQRRIEALRAMLPKAGQQPKAPQWF